MENQKFNSNYWFVFAENTHFDFTTYKIYGPFNTEFEAQTFGNLLQIYFGYNGAYAKTKVIECNKTETLNLIEKLNVFKETREYKEMYQPK